MSLSKINALIPYFFATEHWASLLNLLNLPFLRSAIDCNFAFAPIVITFTVHLKKAIIQWPCYPISICPCYLYRWELRRAFTSGLVCDLIFFNHPRCNRVGRPTVEFGVTTTLWNSSKMFRLQPRFFYFSFKCLKYQKSRKTSKYSLNSFVYWDTLYYFEKVNIIGFVTNMNNVQCTVQRGRNQ